jgi:hypothetical protein
MSERDVAPGPSVCGFQEDSNGDDKKFLFNEVEKFFNRYSLKMRAGVEGKMAQTIIHIWVNV